MLDSILGKNASLGPIVLCLLATLVMGVIFSVIYCLFKQKDGYAKDTPLAFTFLPVVIAGITIILSYSMFFLFEDGGEVSSRYGRVLIALLSAIIMIRFRSVPKSAEDLTYLFFLTGIGLINGMGYLLYGLILFAIVLVLFIVLYLIKFPFLSKRNLKLKITIPEDLNYEHVFDDLFAEYTSYHNLTKVKTSDMGTMFVLTYEIVMKKKKSNKELIDLIRERNGNLNIVLTVKKFDNN